MKKTKISIIILVLICIMSAISGCGTTASNSNSTPKTDEKPVTLTISAAASLKDAFGDIKKLYKNEKSNVTLNYNFGSSGELMTQIEQGAPADAFISAGTKQMDELKQKGLLIDSTDKNLLKNEVVLVVPKSGSAVKKFENLTDSSVKKIGLGEPKSVPAGQYGVETLTKMGIYNQIQSKAVYAKDVKQVLAWVESGDADAGIVYTTDAKISKKVKVVATANEKYHSPIIYPEAVIKATSNEAAAKAFLKYLSSDSAKKVFKKYGFTIYSK